MRSVKKSATESVCLNRITLGVIAAVLFFGTNAQSATKAGAKAPGSTQTSLNPDALSAKAFLEGLIVRRYNLELGTIVDHEAFTLGAQLDLAPVPPVTATKAPEPEPFTDLMLGTLDADSLAKAQIPLAPADERTLAQKVLENYRIRAVNVSVGLHDDLDPKVKTDVEQWLKKRLSTEFGSAAKGFVSIIQRVPIKKIEKPEEKVPETLIDYIGRYQSFAGQAVIAAAIILGIFLWLILSKMLGLGGAAAGAGDGMGLPNGAAATEDSSDFASLAQAAQEIQAEQALEAKNEAEAQEREINRSGRDVESLKLRLRELTPRLTNYLEEIIRQWCMMGDAGRLRLACFAEAAGKETGKLPIPVDALPEVQKVFAKMTEISTKDKREALEKAYWDLLSTLNLGSESLSQPFSYIDGMNLTMVNKVLMDQNPKLKTLVSLYMNKDMRGRYLKSLNLASKKELLLQAAQMSEIRADELETFDRGLMGRINPTVGQEIVPLEMSFMKIVDALTPIEEITILSEMKNDAIEIFKRTRPSLAFLHQWPDDKLRVAMIGITPDELITYLRLRPEMKERMLSLASMMVSEIAGEELNAPDKSPLAEKEKAIDFFTTRIRTLVEQNDVNLEEVFGPLEISNVLQLNPDSASDGGKQVA